MTNQTDDYQQKLTKVIELRRKHCYLQLDNIPEALFYHTSPIWVETLDSFDIPLERYDELFMKVINWRVECLRQGEVVRDFTVEQMIMCDDPKMKTLGER